MPRLPVWLLVSLLAALLVFIVSLYPLASTPFSARVVSSVSQPPAVRSSALNRSLVIHYSVAVVVFGDEAVSAPRVLGKGLVLGGWRLHVVYSVAVVRAPGWAVGELSRWLRLHSRASGAGLPRGCGVNATRVYVVDLPSYYGFAVGLARRVLLDAGVEARDVFVVVGRGVGPGPRLLVASAPSPWQRGFTATVRGVPFYAGWLHAVLVDEAAIRLPYPRYPVPFLGARGPLGCGVGPGEPLARLLREHLLWQVLAPLPGARPWYRRVLGVRVVVVAYSNETARQVLGYSDTGETARLLRRLDPWMGFNVSLSVSPPRAAPWGRYPLNATRLPGGYLVVDLDRNPGLLNALEGESRRLRLPGGGCSEIRVYVLALRGPAFLSSRSLGLNFTGLSLGCTVIAAYPGYYGRLTRAGLPRVVAHEAGHSMGLPHPFQDPRNYTAVDWLLDYTYTVMSYDDNITAAAPPGAVMSYSAETLALLHVLALLEKHPSPAAVGLLEKGDVGAALRALLTEGEGR